MAVSHSGDSGRLPGPQERDIEAWEVRAVLFSAVGSWGFLKWLRQGHVLLYLPLGPGSPSSPVGPRYPGGPRAPGWPMDPGGPGGPGGPAGPGLPMEPGANGFLRCAANCAICSFGKQSTK